MAITRQIHKAAALCTTDMSSAQLDMVSETALDQLAQLEKLRADEYIVATGARGRQFYATSNGYSA